MINFKTSTCTMWHTTKGTHINNSTYILKTPILSNHWPLLLWHLSFYLRTKISYCHLQCLPLTARSHHNILLGKWRILYSLTPLTDYSSCRIKPCIEWTIVSAQLEDTEQHLPLEEFMQHCSTPPNLMPWLICQMRLSWQEWWLPCT